MKPVGILRVRSSTERGRSWFSPIGFGSMAVGLVGGANGEKGNGRVRRHGDVCKLADGALYLPKQ